MSDLRFEINLKSEVRAKLEMDMAAFEKANGVPTVAVMEYSITKTMSKSKQSTEAWKHNTANPEPS